ncbi:rhodanese-like domain-containing protein [Halioxenophilus sp. WMMB6]|uniref:rhodanese-like domain-containing protein n=1 Tax=Halioxenophilus sp. WMMB6 TaxID=3073815 RepID=UPI00295F1CB6|nr:rhodanese-like domain-containing protein [Halioxenophilus sp. WMMB6]
MKDAHALVGEAKQMIEEVNLDAAEQAIQEAAAVIDVREPDEFRQGHVPGAINIPRGLLEFKLTATPELTDRDLNLVVYCKSSGRAALAAKSLQEMGYLKVKSIAGGFDAWAAAGKAVVTPKAIDFN